MQWRIAERARSGPFHKSPAILLLAQRDHEVRYLTPQDAMMSCLPRNLCLDADAWRLIQIVRGEGYVLTANLERFGPGGR